MGKTVRSKLLTDIVAKLSGLDRGELEHLRSRIGASLSVEPDLAHARNGKGPDRDDVGFVLECIGTTLSSLGVEYAHAGMLRKAQGFGAFKEKVPGIMSYLQNAHLDKQGQHAIICMGVELLYREMGRAGLTITGRTILNHAHRIPSMINSEFPDYANCGTLGILIQSARRKKESKDVRKERSDQTLPIRGRIASRRR